LREPGVRIDVHLRGLQQRGDGRPGPAAAMAAREEPIDGVGVDLDTAVAQEALEGCAPGRGIADRLGEFAFAGQAGQLRLPQIEERCGDGGLVGCDGIEIMRRVAERNLTPPPSRNRM
jgi:hypothetical protein